MLRPSGSGEGLVEVGPRDLGAALRDPAIRAIRVAADHTALDDLDVEAIRSDPKPIVGSGGTTFVHLELWRRCGLVGFHGSFLETPATHRGPDGAGVPEAAVALRGPGGAGVPETTAGLRGPGGAGVPETPVALRGRDGAEAPEMAVVLRAAGGLRVSGLAKGPLLGGDLEVVRAMIGAGLPDLDGAILLLTGERTVGLGQVDRQLTHLRRAGILGRVSGVAVGVFAGFDGYVDRGWTLHDVLADHLGALPIPVVGGLPIGTGAAAVPIGPAAVLDADAGTLAVSPGFGP